MMEWFRWHHGTVNDPKWRVVSRKSGQPVVSVLAVFAAFLERASQSDKRGSIEGWDADDIGAGLDIDGKDVVAIHAAMQGKVLDGDILTGWDKRQPKREREDPNSTERSRKRREAQKDADDGSATPCNAMQRHATPRLDKTREEDSEPNGSGAEDAPADLKSIIFGKGLDWLAKQTGKSRDSLRSALGRACSKYGDAVVIEVLGAAMREGPIDPLAWMERAFQARGSPKKDNSTTRRNIMVGSPEWKKLEEQGLV